MNKLQSLWLVLCVLQVLDLGTTYLGLGAGASEQNPVGVAALEMGFKGLVVAKIIATVTALIITAFLVKQGHWKRAVQGTVISVGMMGLVVAWNTTIIFLHLG